MNTNPNSKRIVCFGDSYTWGYIPSSGHQRFPNNIRWTGVLQNKLGDSFEIIEEGLNSRTLNSDDTRPGKEGRNGSSYLIPCLDSHDPIFLVILMLGTNELKDEFDVSEKEIYEILDKQFVNIIVDRKSQSSNDTPKLLLISPPLLDLTYDYSKSRYSKSKELNMKLPEIYKDLANKYNCEFIDSAKFVKVGSDGDHIDEDNHRILGEEIARVVKSIDEHTRTQ